MFAKRCRVEERPRMLGHDLVPMVLPRVYRSLAQGFSSGNHVAVRNFCSVFRVHAYFLVVFSKRGSPDSDR